MKIMTNGRFAALLMVLALGAPIIWQARFAQAIFAKVYASLPQVDLIAQSISGDYSGQATLQGVYNGVWSSNAAIADKDKMDLGYIDLAFSFAPSSQNVSGNVILSRTLVFSNTDGDISVTGKMVGNSLQLTSSQFTMKMNEARIINGEQVAPERIVTRQFSLITDQILNDGATLTGIYRETIWGYAPEPVTVVGKFALERPIFGANIVSPPASQKVYLPITIK